LGSKPGTPGGPKGSKRAPGGTPLYPQISLKISHRYKIQGSQKQIAPLTPLGTRSTLNSRREAPNPTEYPLPHFFFLHSFQHYSFFPLF